MASPDVPAIDDERALSLVTRMMAIPGKSGQERQVTSFIEDELRAAGVPESAIEYDGAHRRSPVDGEVGNLIVRLPGTRRAPRRLLAGHVDTVPLCVGSQPVRKGAFIHSKDPKTALGGDNRAGASVVLNALLEVVRNDLPHPPLTALWPVQEEIGLYGARFVSKSKLGNPKLCFNWDGGAPNVAVIGATGDYAITVDVFGIASHAGAHPDEGVSAIAIAAEAVADLHRNGWHGLIKQGRHAGTSNVGAIEGGDATNVVTPHVTVRAEARSHDPRFRKRIVDEFRKAFERAARSVRNANGESGHASFCADLKYEAFSLQESEPSVQAALAAVEAVGLKAETRIVNGGLDANWLCAHGLPTVTLGCGQDAIHTVDERLHVESYLQACRIGMAIASGVE